MSRPLPKLGVTTYSFTPQYHGLELSFEDIVRRIGSLGIGPGLEIVGFQSIKGFPEIPDDFVRLFRGLVDEYGLEPSCLAVNADLGLLPDRLLSPQEMADYLAPQVRAAAELGFPAVRLQKPAAPEAVELLLRVAEKEQVKMGFEIHAPDSVHSDWVMALRELYARLDSPYLGFIPDFGSSTRRVSPSVWEEYRRRGVSQEALDTLDARWNEIHASDQRPSESELMGEFSELTHSLGLGAFAHPLAMFCAGIHGHQDPQDWAEIGSQIIHVHSKFFGFDEDGDEPAIPLADLLKVLVDAGYTGYLSSEWEGWHWDPTPDAAATVQRHHRLSRDILESL
ncbi:sugar phosphate isomerase/epimerase family protein [Streptomyces cylindrosporus]|uniref:Sugar phosphate isomerase/epimerase n=1 Tax=Streptomyces cylindrosporus TaxID=2927583 RepID=A0ABS9Y0K3_9ACTN|nr:TIM barrel protein [Streptomyces cylindrosporus]MCI3270755.1 sugar phosphate isomerase/epimerase [Streptomyces cylindrosporus]